MGSEEVLKKIQELVEAYEHTGISFCEETEEGWEAECLDCGTIFEISYSPLTAQYYFIGEISECPKYKDYSELTNEEFDQILEEIVGGMSSAEILSYGDVYNILAEELNNEVLDRWRAKKEEEHGQS